MAKQESFGTLSGAWVRKATDIIDCLAGEGYNYLHYDVTKVNDPTTFPNKKLVLGLRVEVPENQRDQATKNIQEAVLAKKPTGPGTFTVAGGSSYTYKMNEDGAALKDREIDIPIVIRGYVGKEKIIRIQVKPVKGGGSGGGSAATAINECMFAVYAAARFHILTNNWDPDKGTDEKILKQAYDKHCDLDRPFEELWADPVWHHSHCIGANMLYNKMQNPKMNNPVFVHGKGKNGQGIDDKEINAAYKAVNLSLSNMVPPKNKFQKEDKWNPSDIWMIEKGFSLSGLEELCKEKSPNAATINDYFVQQFHAKKLVGVSLKKTTNAKWDILNDNPDLAVKQNKVKGYSWIEKNGTGGYDLLFENRGGNPIDVYLYYGSGSFDKFQLRNFGGQKDSWQIELKGATAAHGRCGGGQVAAIVNGHCPGAMPWAGKGVFFNECNKKGSNKVEITREISQALVDFKAINAKGKKTWERDLAQYKSIVANKEAPWRYSKLNGLRLLKALKNNPDKANKIIQDLYLFCSSQLEYSSIFAKVY